MKTRYLIGPLAVLALLFAGCGDDGGDETGEDASSSQTDSDSSGTGSDSDGTSDSSDAPSTVDPDDLATGEGAFDAIVPEQCEFLFDLSAAVGLAATGQIDASQFSKDEAPEEVRGDVEVLLDAFTSYDPTNPASVQVFTSGEFQQASENISSFVEENCEPAAGN